MIVYLLCNQQKLSFGFLLVALILSYLNMHLYRWIHIIYASLKSSMLFQLYVLVLIMQCKYSEKSPPNNKVLNPFSNTSWLKTMHFLKNITPRIVTIYFHFKCLLFHLSIELFFSKALLSNNIGIVQLIMICSQGLILQWKS